MNYKLFTSKNKDFNMSSILKGSSAVLPIGHSLSVSLCWTDLTDYDFSVYYRAKDGSSGLIYFGGHLNTNEQNNSSPSGLGSLTAFPFILLAGDEGIGDWGGENAERLTIQHLDKMSEVYLLCWDYEGVNSGKNAPFEKGDVSIKIKDEQENELLLLLCNNAIGNIAAIAKLETTEAGVVAHNISSAGTLKELNFKEIAAICI